MVYKIRGNPIGFSEPLFTGTKITKIRHASNTLPQNLLTGYLLTILINVNFFFVPQQSEWGISTRTFIELLHNPLAELSERILNPADGSVIDNV